MRYNNSVDYAARMFERISQAEIYLIVQQLVSIEVLDKIRHQHIVRCALFRVRSIIIVVYLIILQRYIKKS